MDGLTLVRPMQPVNNDSSRRLDSLHHHVLAEHFERLKQRRCILSPANRHPNRLEHLPGFNAELLRRPSQRLVQRVVSELC